MFSSCQKDDERHRDTVTLKAIIADTPNTSGNSKVYIDESQYACWHNGDLVNINGDSYVLSLDESNAATILEVAASNYGYTAVYPYVDGAVSGVGATTATVAIPSTQIYRTKADGGAVSHQEIDAPMVGYCGAGESVLKFYNAASLMKLNITNSTGVDLNIHYIVVTTPDSALSGRATINVTGATPTLRHFTDSCHSVTLDCSSNKIFLANGATSEGIYVACAPFSEQPVTVRVLAKKSNDTSVYYTFLVKSHTTVNEVTTDANLSLSRNMIGTVPVSVTSSMAYGKAFWGNGTESNPYIIANKDDLIRFRGYLSSGNGTYAKNASVHYLQINDIDCSSSAWTSSGEFWGCYDGCGHSIKLQLTKYISGNSTVSGLFAVLSGATIRNLVLCGDSVSLSSDKQFSFGGFCGIILGTSGSKKTVFENCVNNIAITAYQSGTSSENAVGGFVARATAINVTFRDCTNNGSISASTKNISQLIYSGGIMGYGKCDTLLDCRNLKRISGKGYVGGFIGYLYQQSLRIEGTSVNNGDIIGTGDYVGGFIGYSNERYITVKGVASNSGNIRGRQYVAGMVGYQNKADMFFIGSYNGSISNSGNIVGSSSNVGGILGYHSGTYGTVIKNANNCGEVVGSYHVAGICGYSSSYVVNISNCFNTGKIKATGGNVDNSTVAGVVGFCGGSTACFIEKCCNSSDSIIASSGAKKIHVGGVVGIMNCKGHLYNCYNTATLKGSSIFTIGGVVGRLNGIDTIANCYNNGTIIGTVELATGVSVGGVIGQSRSNVHINNCYNSASVSGVTGMNFTYRYGVAAIFSGTINLYNCYGPSDVSFAGNTYYPSSGTTINKYRCARFNTSSGALYKLTNSDVTSVTVNTLNVADDGSTSYSTLKDALTNWCSKNSSISWLSWTNDNVPTF